MLDVAIVGAGPAGGQTARLLAEADLNVTLYEEHRVVGDPCQCAGLISPRVFEELGFQHPPLNTLHGAQIYGPSGHYFRFHTYKPRGLAIDRPEFDRAIVERAADSGVEVSTGCRVHGSRWRGDHVAFRVRTTEGSCESKARVLVGADGPSSHVARDFGIKNTGETLMAMGNELTGWAHAEDTVYVFVGRSVAPLFFAWIIPTGNGGARIGLAQARGHGAIRHRYQKFLNIDPVADLISGCELSRPMGGTIPLGYNPQAYGDGVILVGDAAGVAKPTSGGGIYTGLVSARLAAQTIIEVLERGEPQAKALARYQHRLNSTLGRELKRGKRLRSAFVRLSDEMFDELVGLLADPEVIQLIEEHGDIDYASRVATAVLKKKPQLLKFAPLLLKPFV